MTHWFQQIVSVSLFNLKGIPQRKGSAVSAMVGIAGVVMVLTGVLAISEGFKKAMTANGAPDVAVVLRGGSDSEMNSGLTREDTRVISEGAGVVRTSRGPMTSSELFVIINLPKRSTGTDANVPLRGVQENAFAVRGQIKLVAGRKIEPGKNEIMVGSGAARAFAGLDLGNEIRIGPNVWKVVGIFTAEGGIADSELWTDAAVLQPAYHRGNTFQSVYVKLNSAAALEEFTKSLADDPRLNLKISRLSEFYADQSKTITKFITTIGVLIAAMMAVGALFAALNTMYGAVSARTREIATLRAIGFNSGPVIVSVLAESMALALIGGAAGAGAAWLAFDGYRASTLNWQSFSQVTFAFAVTPELLVQAIIWAAVLGLIGGIFPAIRAAKLPISAALRGS